MREAYERTVEVRVVGGRVGSRHDKQRPTRYVRLLVVDGEVAPCVSSVA